MVSIQCIHGLTKGCGMGYGPGEKAKMTLKTNKQLLLSHPLFNLPSIQMKLRTRFSAMSLPMATSTCS